MNKLLLKARNQTSEMRTFEVDGPKFVAVARRLDLQPPQEHIVQTYNTPGEAVCKYFQLLARHNLQPVWD